MRRKKIFILTNDENGVMIHYEYTNETRKSTVGQYMYDICRFYSHNL